MSTSKSLDDVTADLKALQKTFKDWEKSLDKRALEIIKTRDIKKTFHDFNDLIIGWQVKRSDQIDEKTYINNFLVPKLNALVNAHDELATRISTPTTPAPVKKTVISYLKQIMDPLKRLYAAVTKLMSKTKQETSKDKEKTNHINRFTSYDTHITELLTNEKEVNDKDSNNSSRPKIV